MKKKLVLFSISLFLFSLLFSCQKHEGIMIDLPEEANKNYVFLLNKGIRQDTLLTGKFDSSGKTSIVIPPAYKDFVGVGSLCVDQGVSLNLVLNHEDFSVSKGENNQYVFDNSKENTYLYSSFDNKAMPKDTSLYADQLIKMFSVMQNLNSVGMGGIPVAKSTEIQNFVLDSLNFDNLYTSGLWFFIVDGAVKLSRDQNEMANNMIRILKRVKSDEVFEDLTSNLITITNQYGYDDAFDVIIPYIEQTERIKNPTGKIQSAFVMSKVRKGIKAPLLEGLMEPDKKFDKTLLIFYQPDCANCEIQLKLLSDEYLNVIKKNIRVVSISSDHTKESFDKDVARLPWKDKLCDFRGFAGNNFINYGIVGTPIYYLLDNEMMVIGRYSNLREVIFSLN